MMAEDEQLSHTVTVEVPKAQVCRRGRGTCN